MIGIGFGISMMRGAAASWNRQAFVPKPTIAGGSAMTTSATTTKTYVLDGSLLEACSCAGPCPCWVGDDPDGGKCDAFNAFHIDRGQIKGVDVSGLTLVRIAQIPGNVLAGNWREVIYVDDKANPEQRQAILDAWIGKLGGPLADLAGLIGERVGVYSAPIEHRVENGKGTLRVGEALYSEMAPYTDAAGRPTKLIDTGHCLHDHPRLTRLCRQSIHPSGASARARDDLGVHWPQRHPGRLPFRGVKGGS
jgi:hypothetical protein